MAKESCLVVSVAENQKISASFVQNVQSLAYLDVVSISIRIFGHNIFNYEDMETKLVSATLKASDLRLHFNLKQMRDPNKLTQIMLVTTVNKQRIRVYTQLRVEPKYWDKKNNRCVANQSINMRDRRKPVQVNKILNELEMSIYQVDKKFSDNGKYLDPQIVRKTIVERQTIGKTDTQPLAYMYQQIDDYLNGLNRRGKRGIASTQRTYHTALKRLEAFCKLHPIRTFEDFDNKFFNAFANYLYGCSYQKGKTKKQYTQNTVINTIKVIKNLFQYDFPTILSFSNKNI